MSESEQIVELNRKMDRIESMLRANATNCEKMSKHIDFVERIYEYVKAPLFFLTDRFRYLTRSQAVPPSLEPRLIENHSDAPTVGEDEIHQA